jgi:hypothetical protein
VPKWERSSRFGRRHKALSLAVAMQGLMTLYSPLALMRPREALDEASLAMSFGVADVAQQAAQ